ncbi:alpha/beta hydrolase family protein [Candidatus Zixiibacteriota bacterium]
MIFCVDQPDRQPLIRGYLFLLLFLLLPLRISAWQDLADFTGHWEGAMDLQGTDMSFMIDLILNEGIWSGRMDIPMQNAFGLPLSTVRVVEDTVAFTIQAAGDPVWTGILSGERIEGNLVQSGITFPFWLGREEMPPPPRPQEPMPPFPYREEEVVYQNGEVTLAGTLTLPPDGGPFPAALLITGSGAQDRNGELFDHKPFLLIADVLTSAGVAVLRVDDRGVGGSSLGPRPATSADFVEDVLSGVDLLISHNEIDPMRIGLIGHSEGGMIAPMAAAASDNVAFIVLLAGPGVTGEEILLEQTLLITKTTGATEEQLLAQFTAQQKALGLARIGADSLTVREAVAGLVDVQFARLSDMERQAVTPEIREQQITQATNQVLHPWFRYFLGFDPRTALREVTVPVLAINGGLDLQVSPAQNLPEIAIALGEAGNTDITVREFPGLNHLFQTARSGSPAEYALTEETISPAVLETIRDWILDRFGTGLLQHDQEPEIPVRKEG